MVAEPLFAPVPAPPSPHARLGASARKLAGLFLALTLVCVLAPSSARRPQAVGASSAAASPPSASPPSASHAAAQSPVHGRAIEADPGPYAALLGTGPTPGPGWRVGLAGVFLGLCLGLLCWHLLGDRIWVLLAMALAWGLRLLPGSALPGFLILLHGLYAGELARGPARNGEREAAQLRQALGLSMGLGLAGLVQGRLLGLEAVVLALGCLRLVLARRFLQVGLLSAGALLGTWLFWALAGQPAAGLVQYLARGMALLLAAPAQVRNALGVPRWQLVAYLAAAALLLVLTWLRRRGDGVGRLLSVAMLAAFLVAGFQQGFAAQRPHGAAAADAMAVALFTAWGLRVVSGGVAMACVLAIVVVAGPYPSFLPAAIQARARSTYVAPIEGLAAGLRDAGRGAGASAARGMRGLTRHLDQLGHLGSRS